MPASRMNRRSSSADVEDATDEKPRRRSRTEESPADEKSARRGRRSSAAAEEESAPTRSRRSRGDSDDSGEEKTGRRSRRSSGAATGGFASYREKRTANSDHADEFKPADNSTTLIKFLDPEPFDNYQQHWIDDFKGTGKRLSYVCRDDDYFADDEGEKGCPLCDIGEPTTTKSLFNVLNLDNPRKPVVQVWSTTVTISDKLERMASEKKTSPLDRDDLYFEVNKVKKPRKTEWDIQPVKARDLQEDFDMEPLEDAELTEFLENLFKDRTAVTKVDSYEELDELAESLD